MAENVSKSELTESYCGHTSSGQDRTALAFLSATKVDSPRKDSMEGIVHAMDIALVALYSLIMD